MQNFPNSQVRYSVAGSLAVFDVWYYQMCSQLSRLFLQVESKVYSNK